MDISTKDLDGMYQVSTSPLEGTDFQGYSDGMTRIQEGRTNRVDGAGCKWTSTFTVLDEHEVEMTSTVDPSDTPEDFKIKTPDGEETREPVSYSTVLQISEDRGKLCLEGEVQLGDNKARLKMKKI